MITKVPRTVPHLQHLEYLREQQDPSNQPNPENISFPTSGELRPGQELVLPQTKKSEPIDFTHDFLNISSQEKQIVLGEERTVEQRVETLQKELRIQIAQSGKTQDSTVREIEKSINSNLPLIGTYHENFFDRLRGIFQRHRESLQDAGTWLRAASSKPNRNIGARLAKGKSSFNDTFGHRERSTAFNAAG